MDSSGSALELGGRHGLGAAVSGSQRNCDAVSSRENVTWSGGPIRSPQSPRRVPRAGAGVRGQGEHDNGRGGWKAEMVSGQWRYDGWGLVGTRSSDPAPGRLQRGPVRGASPLGRSRAAPMSPKARRRRGPGRTAGPLGG